ncbi:RNA binding protein, putative isoform 3 [Hibiscus syriacus]|uniref:RNA binding protein, putative isoform 3 n=1 Tax=Hibiscus syriacus TaxID=106335 RepID=A0A6A3CUR8_HIBSY|nr:RNA binding protein, putative isoform 3 [Hibiscus syriacus]
MRRYVEDKELQSSIPVNDINEQASTSALAPEPAHDHLVEDPISYAEDEDINSGAEVLNPSDNEEGSVLEDAPKKSYASIVKVIKSNTALTPVYVPTNNVRVTAAPKEPHSIISAKPALVTKATLTNSDNAPESSNDNEEGIHVRVRGIRECKFSSECT